MRDALIEKMYGFRPSEYIQKGLCVPAPTGCGQPVSPFAQASDEVEYKISGLCSECQKKYFKETS